MLVVAGAGTGKTRVITHRIAYLIAQKKARPSEILALTFTEKAAREMEDRLYELIGWESFQVPVMTFHAFGTELLTRYASHVGRSIRGGLLNDMQKTLLLQQHLDRFKFRYYGPQSNIFEFLEGVVAYIGMLQNAGITVDAYLKYAENLHKNPGKLHLRDVDEQLDLAGLYKLYEDLKVETGTFDYNDQLQVPLRILTERPNLAARLAREYRFVQVDEYQDTNAVQDELLRTFIGHMGNLFAVGDDDQAIYGFRGADIGNILSFTDHFKLEKPVVLVQNYRSGQAILDSAYQLIRNNDPERLEAKLGINKRLLAQHNDCMAKYVPYATTVDEQQGVLEAISERLAAGEVASDMAVLAATHAPLRSLAKAMRARGIPYGLSSVANIFEQPELIGLWYLLKWLGMQADEEAVGHVIMGPFVGWSAERYRIILERAQTELITVEEALRQEGGEGQELVSQLDEWRRWAGELPVSQLVFKLVFETGRADLWREQAVVTGRMVRVFEDLQRWLDQMQDYETVATDPRLAGYSALFPKPPMLEVAEPVGDASGVQLLTVHASKGLEFDTVFLMGCTQRNWAGSHRALREVPADLKSELLAPEHEQRRLMYVAVTRAKRHLELSAPTRTMGGAKQAVSPFVAELFGAEVLQDAPMERANEDIEKLLTKLQHFYPMKNDHSEDNLPFESQDGWLELNVTSLAGYEYCPFEFYLQHVLGIKQPFGPQLGFGNALHRVLESLLKSRLAGQERSAEELHAMVDEQWSERGYETKAAAEADRVLAHETLNNYLKRLDDGRVRGSEVPVMFEVPEAKLRLRGKIDALFEVNEGIEIRDFKTGRTKTDAEKLATEAKTSLQLRTYALAYEVLNGKPPARVGLDYIVTGVQGVAALSPAILRNHRAKLVQLAERIRARDFAPNPSPLHHCAAIRYYGTGEQDAMFEEMMLSEGVSE